MSQQVYQPHCSIVRREVVFLVPKAHGEERLEQVRMARSLAKDAIDGREDRGEEVWLLVDVDPRKYAVDEFEREAFEVAKWMLRKVTHPSSGRVAPTC